VPEDWSPEEVAATVADYFVMLGHELRGEPYNKREHNLRLQALLRGRSAGAIEFKHANISAVLIELGFPYIDGYKPRYNYQELLKEEVTARLIRDESLNRAAEQAVATPVYQAPEVLSLSDILVPAPSRERNAGRSYERQISSVGTPDRVNYLAREARNASLGAAGELFVLRIERQRLREIGQPRLAERIEHVSRSKGDGLGYDILSFDADGRERIIEVKTTNFGSMTPFFASAREVAVSEERQECFSLYRVFRFRESPKVFALNGSLRLSCVLDAVEYRASLP
jgi:hypothetical protein